MLHSQRAQRMRAFAHFVQPRVVVAVVLVQNCVYELPDEQACDGSHFVIGVVYVLDQIVDIQMNARLYGAFLIQIVE